MRIYRIYYDDKETVKDDTAWDFDKVSARNFEDALAKARKKLAKGKGLSIRQIVLLEQV